MYCHHILHLLRASSLAQWKIFGREDYLAQCMRLWIKFANIEFRHHRIGPLVIVHLNPLTIPINPKWWIWLENGKKLWFHYSNSFMQLIYSYNTKSLSSFNERDPFCLVGWNPPALLKGLLNGIIGLRAMYIFQNSGSLSLWLNLSLSRLSVYESSILHYSVGFVCKLNCILPVVAVAPIKYGKIWYKS